jgi:hypothetical protein
VLHTDIKILSTIGSIIAIVNSNQSNNTISRYSLYTQYKVSRHLNMASSIRIACMRSTSAHSSLTSSSQCNEEPATKIAKITASIPHCCFCRGGSVLFNLKSVVVGSDVISCRSRWGTEASISSLMLMSGVDCTFKTGTTNSKAIGHAKFEPKGQHNTERQFCTIIHDQIGRIIFYICVLQESSPEDTRL